jgi:hypothetical protein
LPNKQPVETKDRRCRTLTGLARVKTNEQSIR